MSDQPGHAWWCDEDNCDETNLDHSWSLLGILADEALVTLTLSQPADEPLLTISTDAGPVFTLRGRQMELFAGRVGDAAGMAAGHWPDWYVA